jgi:protein O-mannosyl-transferase
MSRRSGISKRLVVVCLLGVTLLLYSPVGHHEFLTYDDPLYVTDNSHVRSGMNYENIIWAWTALDLSNWHPVTWLSHMIDCMIFGLNPGGHHLVSVLFHCANVLLLFWILEMGTGAFIPSAFVAAVFGVHPLNLESVAWVAERKNVLSTFFFLLSILAYFQYVRSPDWKGYSKVTILFVLGLMSKPMAVTLPCVLLLLDYWPLGRWGERELESRTGGKTSGTRKVSNRDKPHLRGTEFGSRRSWLVLEKFPLLLLSGLSSVITVKASERAGDLRSLKELGLYSRMFNAAVSYVEYIGKLVWPTNLAVFYPPREHLSTGVWLMALLLVVGISIGVFCGARRFPYLPMGWLWFLVTLLPVIGVVQAGNQAMADRYAYVPMIGFFVMITWGATTAGEYLGLPSHWVAILGVSALTAFTVATALQLTYWQNSYSLFRHTLQATNQNNYIAHGHLGVVSLRQGRIDEGIQHFTTALETNPGRDSIQRRTMVRDLVRLGNALEDKERLDEAVKRFQSALEIDPSDATAHNNLGNVLAQLGKADEAIIQYQKTLTLTNDVESLVGIHLNLGNTLGEIGRREDAVFHYSQAVRLQPNNFQAQASLGIVLYFDKKLEDATDHLSKAIDVKRDARAYFFLGLVLADRGKLQEAIQCLREALILNPEYSEAREHLNLLLKDPSG